MFCLHHQIADYYYDERMCLLRCVLLLLTYFQDERHPFRVTELQLLCLCLFCRPLERRILEIVFHYLIVIVLVFVQTEYCNCVNKLEKDLINNYQAQFEKLFKAEAPTWETHGNLMVTLSEKCHLRGMNFCVWPYEECFIFVVLVCLLACCCCARRRGRCPCGSCSVWGNSLSSWRSSSCITPTLRWARQTCWASPKCSKSKALVWGRPTGTWLTRAWTPWWTALGKTKTLCKLTVYPWCLNDTALVLPSAVKPEQKQIIFLCPWMTFKDPCWCGTCVSCRYLSSLILVEGIDIEFLHKCALENCTDQHQFSSAPEIIKVGFTFFCNLALVLQSNDSSKCMSRPRKNKTPQCLKMLRNNHSQQPSQMFNKQLSQNPSWSVVGNGPTAHHTWRHCSPRPGSPGLGAAQTHSAAGRVQPHRQENRQCDAAAGSLQVHLNHVEEPVAVWKWCENNLWTLIVAVSDVQSSYFLVNNHFSLSCAVHCQHGEDVHVRTSVICHHVLRSGEPAGIFLFSLPRWSTLCSEVTHALSCGRLTALPRRAPIWPTPLAKSSLPRVWPRSSGKWWEKLTSRLINWLNWMESDC